MYKFEVERLIAGCPEIINWCLDFPMHQGEVLQSDLETDGVVFQGWVLSPGNPVVKPYIRINEKIRYFDLNVNRPDVIAKVLAHDPAGHPLLKCGFRFRSPLEAGEVLFGFQVGGLDFDHARLSVRGELKVLEGLDGWLFLDNDTNRSVDQFTGKWLLDRHCRKLWLAFLNNFAKVAAELRARHAVLIAPAKEMVLAQYYPHRKGRITPVEQVLEMATDQHLVVYPAASFHATAERPFRLNDTHWTPWGAMLAAVDTLMALGVDRDQVQALFAQDAYKEKEVTGDLGRKFYPPRTSGENFLVSFNYHKYIIYDNHLPNLGRVMVVANKSALLDSKCLIFGSSSSYSMLDYFTRVFSEIVLVHSAGNIDLDLLKHEGPRYVVSQTNGRFVVRPPVVGYDLRTEITEKLAGLTETAGAEVLHKAAQWLAKCDSDQGRYYHAMLQAAAAREP